MHPQSLELLKAVAILTAAFVPLHQGIIELFKLLSRMKQRRFYQQLAYIVFGDSAKLPFGKRTILDPFPCASEKWRTGPQSRLIEAFLARGVGDDPVTEISDADVENVCRISRLAAPDFVQELLHLLDQLLEGRLTDGNAAADFLEEFNRKHNEDEQVQQKLKDWITRLKGKDDQTATVLLYRLREDIVAEYVPGETRARAELGNAMKAAEYRYHNDIGWASFVLAILESVAVVWLVQLGHCGPGEAAFLVFAFFLVLATLLIAPRGTKGLLDAVIGIGAKLKQ